MNLVIDKYLELISKKNKLISLCIKEKVDNKRITHLVNQGYYYDEKDIIEVLNVRNIQMAKTMINCYSEPP